MFWGYEAITDPDDIIWGLMIMGLVLMTGLRLTALQSISMYCVNQNPRAHRTNLAPMLQTKLGAYGKVMTRGIWCTEFTETASNTAKLHY